VRTGTGFTIEVAGITGSLWWTEWTAIDLERGGLSSADDLGFLVWRLARGVEPGLQQDVHVRDNVDATKGKHTLLFGTDIRKVAGQCDDEHTPFGQQSFTGDEAGYAPADFILGVPRTSITPEGVR